MRDFSFWTYKRLLAVLRCPALVAASFGVLYNAYEPKTMILWIPKTEID